MENPFQMEVLIGEPSSINGPFPMAMLNNQKVYGDKHAIKRRCYTYL